MADLTALRNQIRARAVFAVADAASQLERTFKSTSPRDTGQLQSRTTVQPRGLTAEAKAATVYASHVREGTRPHIIRAKRGKVLSFYWPKLGRQMFLPRVNHPGTRGNSWWDQGLRQWVSFVEEGLRRAP